MVVALLLVLIVMDAALGLNAILRTLLLLGALAVWLLRLRHDRNTVMQGRELEQWITWRMEKQIPHAFDALSNAMDFRERVDRLPDDRMNTLMKSEIHRASEVAAGLSEIEPVAEESRKKEQMRLWMAVSLFVAVSLFSPRLVTTVLHRFLQPFSNLPPFSLTRIMVEPGDASVKYGGALGVSIRVQGPNPGRLSLRVIDTEKGSETIMPLFASPEGIYEQQLERLTQDVRYYVAGRRARSPVFQVNVERTPLIETQQARFDYPSYTRLPKETRYIGVDGISAYAGSKITLLLSANQPVVEGVLTLPGGDDVVFYPGDDPQTVMADFTLQQEGTISAVIRTPDGHESQVWHSKVVIKADRGPEITFVEPGREALATPNARIPLVMEARDDLGVATISLFRNLNASRDHRRIVHADPPPRVLVRVTDQLNLKDLGVFAGDRIQMYATATDSNPNEPHTLASPIHTLQIISEEDYNTLQRQEMTAAELRGQYQVWLENLDRLLEAANDLNEQMKQVQDPADIQNAGVLQKLEDIREQAGKLARAADEQAFALDEESRAGSVYDVEKSYKELLHATAGQVESAAMDLQATAEHVGGACSGQPSGIRDASESLKRAIETLGGDVADTMDRIDEANQDIEQIATLYEAIELYKELLMRQKILVRQTAYYQNLKELSFEDSVRLKELSADEEHIRKDLSNIVQTFLDEAPEISTNYPKIAQDARDLATAIDDLDINGLMARASTELNDRKPVPGHAYARDALDAMESLVQHMDQSQGGMNSDCELRLRIRMGMELGNTLGQLSERIGMGMSGMGAVGRGRSGQGSMASAIQLYGDSASRNNVRQSAMGGGDYESTMGGRRDEMESLSGNIEVIELIKDESVHVKLPEGEPVMEEYRDVITEYFKRMAE
jgi:tetratricopeptide (TPR) repeat protein